MRLNPPKPFSLLLLALSLSLSPGCGTGGREAALGEQFKLAPNESVSIKEAQVTVELKGVRRTWHVDGKSETADADLVVTLEGGEHRQWLKAGEEKAVGDYNVKVWGADPFGKTSAEIIVTRRR